MLTALQLLDLPSGVGVECFSLTGFNGDAVGFGLRLEVEGIGVDRLLSVGVGLLLAGANARRRRTLSLLLHDFWDFLGVGGMTVRFAVLVPMPLSLQISDLSLPQSSPTLIIPKRN